MPRYPGHQAGAPGAALIIDIDLSPPVAIANLGVSQVKSGNDTDGRGAAEAERIADRQHPVTHFEARVCRKLDRRKVSHRLDLENRQVVGRTRLDYRGVDLDATCEPDDDRVERRNEVVVRSDVPIATDDDARAEAGQAVRARPGARRKRHGVARREVDDARAHTSVDLAERFERG